jgi:cytochrome P450
MIAAIDYDPFSPEAMRDPFPAYRELRAAAPMYRLERYDAWAVSRFADVWQVIGDAESFSIHGGPVFVREALAAAVDRARIGGADRKLSFSMWDPPLHTQIRARMSPALRPGALSKLEAEVRALARARLEALLPSRRMDVVDDFVGPISARVTLRALGLPTDDADLLRALVNRFSQRDEDRSGMTARGAQAHLELQTRVQGYLSQGREQGGVAALLRGAQLAGEKLDLPQVATQLVTLLTGGVETLPKILAGGLLELWRAPEQLARLRAGPQLCGRAFEEMIRHQGVLQHVGRTALRGVEVGGARVERGQRLFLLLQSANRDEREFPEPDRFDAFREPPRHLGFGHGAHHCVGIHLARLEGRVLLEEFLRAVPRYRVVESGMLRAASEFQIGYTAMPLEIEPGGRT